MKRYLSSLIKVEPEGLWLQEDEALPLCLLSTHQLNSLTSCRSSGAWGALPVQGGAENCMQARHCYVFSLETFLPKVLWYCVDWGCTERSRKGVMISFHVSPACPICLRMLIDAMEKQNKSP